MSSNHDPRWGAEPNWCDIARPATDGIAGRIALEAMAEDRRAAPTPFTQRRVLEGSQRDGLTPEQVQEDAQRVKWKSFRSAQSMELDE